MIIKNDMPILETICNFNLFGDPYFGIVFRDVV